MSSGLTYRPDWPAIQRQFRVYIASYHAGAPDPTCRDQLFSSIYRAVEYLSAVRYRQYAGHGTKQTEFAVDGVKNLFWKKRRTFTSLITEEYRGEAPIGNFLSTVVGNALRDWFREQNRKRKLDLQLSDDLFRELCEIGIADVPAASMHLAWGIGNPTSGPDEQVELGELRDSLDILSEQDRQLLDLHYFQGMSSAEIAALTGMNHSTVRTRISRAVDAVRVAMTNK